MAVSMGTQLINACKKGDTSLTISLLGNPEAVKKAGHALRAALEHHHIACAQLVLLLAKTMHCEAALNECAGRGYLEGVNLLLAANVVDVDTCYALEWAAGGGHVECVAALIPHCTPKTISMASILHIAAYRGHVDCVKLLIPVSDTFLYNSQALVMAADGGHVDCIEALLPFSDPLADDSYALTTALKRNHQSCVDLLYPASGAPALLQRLQTTYPDQTFLWDKLEQLVLSKEGAGHKNKM